MFTPVESSLFRATGDALVHTMPLFWKPYKSDVTSFLDELKARDPAIEEEQQAGRALLWDRPLDRKALSDWRAAAVPQQAYVYYHTKVK